ncbi:MAG: class I SAM-dependent methyltransferase [Bacteroidota bacterium]
MATDNVLTTWQQNATNWIKTLDEREIASRQWTNPAIVAAVTARQPQSVLDVGCGEGWLLRALHQQAQSPTRLMGVDGVPGLIAAARAAAPSDTTAFRFECLPYAALQPETLAAWGSFDVVVCNYSLFGAESVVSLLRNLRTALQSNGYLVIQTVHASVFDDFQGWIEEDWHLMAQNYTGRYQWYQRNLKQWERDLKAAGYTLREVETVRVPSTQKALSFIFSAQLSR